MRNGLTVNRHLHVNWPITLLMLSFHAAAADALFTFSWPALGVAVLMWWVAGSLGIGIGYHRLLTHRGFRTPKYVEYALTWCGALAFEGGPISWVATHRRHHAYAERDNDPHSPRHGFWWSHLGWIVNGVSDNRAVESVVHLAPDLAKDRFYIWLSRWNLVPTFILCGILYWAGGWRFILWGICFRIVYSWHAAFLVNSAAHTWGSRRFDTPDDSRNNWWVAWLSWGEGWHNNHHAHPASARHGLAWYEIDIHWYGIWMMERLGLARKVRVAELPTSTVMFKRAQA
jgi:stearoyl-CoA desaturase (delta-9 desaturase)